MSNFKNTEELVPIFLERKYKNIVDTHPDFVMWGFAQTPPREAHLKPNIQNEFLEHIRQNNFVGGFAGQSNITERRFVVKSIIHFPSNYDMRKVYRLTGDIGDMVQNQTFLVTPSIRLVHNQTAASKFKETDNVNRIHLSVTFEMLELSL